MSIVCIARTLLTAFFFCSVNAVAVAFAATAVVTVDIMFFFCGFGLFLARVVPVLDRRNDGAFLIRHIFGWHYAMTKD